MVYSTLIRREFGPLDDRRIGSPFLDHETKTLNLQSFVGASNPVLAQHNIDSNRAIDQSLANQSQMYKAYKAATTPVAYGNPITAAGITGNIDNRLYYGGSPHSVSTTPIGVTPLKPTSREAHINNMFNQVGSWDGPFLNHKVDMGGGVWTRTREEKSRSYADLWPELTNQYVAGNLTGNQLFHLAMRESVYNDRDTILKDLDFTSGLNATARANITFGRSGRVSFSTSFGSGGTSFGY